MGEIITFYKVENIGFFLLNEKRSLRLCSEDIFSYLFMGPELLIKFLVFNKGRFNDENL